MKLTIDRAKWLRGEGSNSSRLLRPSDGKMCCLGFYSLACGVSQEAIKGISDPAELAKRNKVPDAMEWLVYRGFFDNIPESYFTLDSPTAQSLMVVNDNTDIGDFTREKKIKGMFAQQGIEVEFVG